MNEKILVIEDEQDINNLICDILKEKNYNVTPAFSGTEGKLWLSQGQYHMILLDLMLPGMSGEELIKEIRTKNNTVPIIVISAKIDSKTKIEVLKLGADDFISKPFDIDEMLARVEANLRRYISYSGEVTKSSIINFKNINLNKDLREVKVNGHLLNLTSREYLILELFLSNPKKVFTRENIFESVWRDTFMGDDNTIKVHISNLRSKIAKLDKDNEYIQTVWGIGFKLKV